MTSTPITEQRSPRLERDSRYRGVCTALARTTGTSESLWHVMFIVLAFFNGIGLLLYMLGVVLIPERGQAQSLAMRLLHGPDRHLDGPDILILVVLGLTAAALGDHSDGFTFLVLAGFALVILSKGPAVAIRMGSGKKEEPKPEPPLVQPYEPVIAPQPPRPTSALGALTVGTAALVVGFLVLLNATTSAGIHAEDLMATALGVVGLGIAVGAWWGRSAALVPLAVLLALGLAATTVARPALDDGVGARKWVPGAGAASYRLGVGQGTLDLSGLTPSGGSRLITAHVEVGHLVVIVPSYLRVSVHAFAELGDLRIFEQDANGHDVTRDVTSGPEGYPAVRLDLSVRTGQVEVRHDF